MSSTVFSREYLKLAPRDTERRVHVGVPVQIGLHALDEYPLHPGDLLSVYRRAVRYEGADRKGAPYLAEPPIALDPRQRCGTPHSARAGLYRSRWG